jgi:hypothetical protein
MPTVMFPGIGLPIPVRSGSPLAVKWQVAISVVRCSAQCQP